MKPRYRWTPRGPVLKALPYPQTPETAHQWLVDHGVAVTELARQHQVPRSTLVDLLRGTQKGRYGQAHRGAIVLGLKPEPDNQRAAA